MQASDKNTEFRHLDALTEGALTAPTSGERSTRIRAWLSGDPPLEQLQEVFRELSSRDKGAARPVRERLDELRRAKGQEVLAAEWSARAEALLALGKINIADAMAWQRDAAKAGAPLSREPLQSLKVRLADRVRQVEDLQHRVQVQREAAVLLAQRIEVLSTKSWTLAQSALSGIQADVQSWQDQAAQLQIDANWNSVDLRLPPLLEASRTQLLAVSDAFRSALEQAERAAADPSAALPQVPMWADELSAARGQVVEAPVRAPRPRVDPQLREQAGAIVREALDRLEAEVAEGHGKASAGAANALRQALKEQGRLIDEALDAQAHAAIAAAGELEGWQRWSANRVRMGLVDQAEGLLKRPAGQEIGGRKMQELLRHLREQWKQSDQGGVPNHALWKRFDAACNEAHKVVEAWVERSRAQATEHQAQRVALLAELQAWATDNRSARDDDWRGFGRVLQEFADRWRGIGRPGDKGLAELQARWDEAMVQARAPLAVLQEQSLQRRQALIAEAVALGAAPMLRVDAVKALQQRWQVEAQAVPIERRAEQKLWDAFRKPIDEAFERKSAERQKAESALGEHEREVIAASRALEDANASADAQRIRTAMTALEQALRGARSATPAAKAASAPSSAAVAAGAPSDEQATSSEPAPLAEPAKPAKPAKPVVAMRGDDRPGGRLPTASPSAPRPAARPGRSDGPPGRMGGSSLRSDPRAARDDRGGRDLPPQGPRLGDAAFRAQRDALERAQLALRKLAAQAHGESLTQLLGAWRARDPAAVPSASDLGSKVPAAARAAWTQALGRTPSGDAATALLRLEIASDTPSPAEHHSARRLYQLQMLTRRHDAPPAQTWTQDVGTVLASAIDDDAERRLRQSLKQLLRP